MIFIYTLLHNYSVCRGKTDVSKLWARRVCLPLSFYRRHFLFRMTWFFYFLCARTDKVFRICCKYFATVVWICLVLALQSLCQRRFDNLHPFLFVSVKCVSSIHTCFIFPSFRLLFTTIIAYWMVDCYRIALWGFYRSIWYETQSLI